LLSVSMEVGLRTKYMFMSINKLQNKVTTYRLAINYLRIWQSSLHIQEWH